MAAPEDLENIDSRFFFIDMSSVKVFDEPRFGPEIWVLGDFVRDGN